MIDVFEIDGNPNKVFSQNIRAMGPDMTSEYKKILFVCQIECVD